jgi:hypothetical protein
LRYLVGYNCEALYALTAAPVKVYKLENFRT